MGRTSSGCLTFVPELEAWLVARQADALAVLRDPETVSPANALRPDVNPPPRVMAELAAGRGQIVVTVDGDLHRRLREPLTRRLPGLRLAPGEPITMPPTLIHRSPERLPLLWD